MEISSTLIHLALSPTFEWLYNILKCECTKPYSTICCWWTSCIISLNSHKVWGGGWENSGAFLAKVFIVFWCKGVISAHPCCRQVGTKGVSLLFTHSNVFLPPPSPHKLQSCFLLCSWVELLDRLEAGRIQNHSCHSQCGPQTLHSSINWEFFINLESHPSRQTYRSESAFWQYPQGIYVDAIGHKMPRWFK